MGDPQDGIRRQSVARSPSAPGPFNHGAGVQQDSIHIKENRCGFYGRDVLPPAKGIAAKSAMQPNAPVQRRRVEPSAATGCWAAVPGHLSHTST